MSYLRFLLRHVYGQQHELPDRGAGHGLKGNGTIPAVYSERIKLAKHAGMQVMEMYRQDIRPRDIMTKEAFMNALTMDMALGCSTNSMLHLPAIAHEAGVELNVDIANEISAKTPNLCHLAPAGPTYIEDLNEAGGIYAVMNEISKKGLLNLDCMTVTGRTVGENIKGCVNKNPDVIRLFTESILPFFPHKEKIQIIEADALEFVEAQEDGAYDYAFSDFWGGYYDGVDLYMQFMPLTARFSRTKHSYWIESCFMEYSFRPVFMRLLMEKGLGQRVKLPERSREVRALQDEFFRYMETQPLSIASADDIDRLLTPEEVTRWMRQFAVARSRK